MSTPTLGERESVGGDHGVSGTARLDHRVSSSNLSRVGNPFMCSRGERRVEARTGGRR
jgi:hypothetical protein